jgi:hypothetical protein
VPTGALLHTYLNPTPEVDDLFAVRLCFLADGDVAIGSYRDDINGTDAGAVYVYEGPAVIPEPMLGDVNGDGQVNGLDVDPFVDVLLSGPYQREADMNEDQVVNGLDVDPFVAAVLGGGTHQIPEPSTLTLLLGGGLCLLIHVRRLRRRRQ